MIVYLKQLPIFNKILTIIKTKGLFDLFTIVETKLEGTKNREIENYIYIYILLYMV